MNTIHFILIFIEKYNGDGRQKVNDNGKARRKEKKTKKNVEFTHAACRMLVFVYVNCTHCTMNKLNLVPGITTFTLYFRVRTKMARPTENSFNILPNTE